MILRVKERVERCIEEVKQGFLYARCCADLVELREELGLCLEKFNNQVHTTTGQILQKLWEEEKTLLKEIPETLIPQTIRKEDKTGLVSHAGYKYSVSLVFKGKWSSSRKKREYCLSVILYLVS